MKELIKKIFAIIDAENESYDMGCLISAEFTPGPDYKEAYKLVEESKYEIKDINNHVKFGLL